MDFTETQQDILYRAWLLARDGNGQVVEDWAYPDAHELAERGWLERRFAGDELAWFWTAQAERTLDIHQLFSTAQASVN